MADILLDEQSFPSTPSTGQGIIFADTTASRLFYKDDSGLYHGQVDRAAVAAQGAGFASDTYVTNSGLIIPSFGLQAGMTFVWVISASKTAAGTATPVYTVRIGTAQTTADTSRLALTGPAQTAATDIGTLTIVLTVRSTGASGVIQGTANWSHDTAAGGFANNDAGTVQGTSSGFDMSNVAGSYVGLSINGGASASWTLTQVVGKMSC